jgi:hypothetical protein
MTVASSSSRPTTALPPAPVAAPHSAADLARDLEAVRDWAAPFWESFDRAGFFAGSAESWSPAHHVRHLVKSNRPVAGALALPKIALMLRFGLAFRPSLRYDALRERYQAALGRGLKAGGYTPSPLPLERQTDEEQAKVIAAWRDTLSTLAAATRRWSEGALDRHRLPHPGMGLLTVREMLMFTVYHNVHHVNGVARRGG